MPKEPLALVSSDWHIRRADRIWYRRDEIYGDTGYSIDQICKLADDYDVPCVIIAGDIFDLKLQQSDALRTMRLALDHFQENNREVLYVQGQHEISTPPLLNAIHPWPEHIHKRTVTWAGYNLYGLDYCTPGAVEAELVTVPEGTDILVTHQVFKDFLGDKHGNAWLEWGFTNARMIITGDYHLTVVQTRDDAVSTLSPGSIVMQDISETPNKFVFILYDDLTVDTVPLRTRRYYEARIETEDALTEFIDAWQHHPARVPQAGVPSNIATNLLRVRYRSDLPQAKRRLEAAIGTSAHLFTDAVRPAIPEQITLEQERRVSAVLSGGLEGCIAEFYSEHPPVRDAAVRLARTTDIQKELLAIYKELVRGNDSN
jgi:hypothetical protein